MTDPETPDDLAAWCNARACEWNRSHEMGDVPHRLRRIAAVLRAVPGLVGAWQPIETAPKDGTPVLLVWEWDSGIHAGRNVVLARWNCREHSLLSRHHDCPNEKDCDMGWNNYAGKMTHWMPLPTAPAAGSRGGGEGGK